jgi:hypothetical protein
MREFFSLSIAGRLIIFDSMHEPRPTVTMAQLAGKRVKVSIRGECKIYKKSLEFGV